MTLPPANALVSQLLDTLSLTGGYSNLARYTGTCFGEEGDVAESLDMEHSAAYEFHRGRKFGCARLAPAEFMQPPVCFDPSSLRYDAGRK